MKCRRTKCSAIIENCIGASIKQELARKLATSQFSLMVDESTDISTTKMLAVSVR